MRKYEPIWQQLKEVGRCEIQAHPAMHARIKKAVIKEKYNDLSHKVRLQDRDSVLQILSDKRDANKMIFILTTSIIAEDL